MLHTLIGRIKIKLRLQRIVYYQICVVSLSNALDLIANLSAFWLFFILLKQTQHVEALPTLI